jgi:hypothetical protein
MCCLGQVSPAVTTTMLRRGPTPDQVASVAVLLASGWTATEVNISAGAVVD